MHFDLVGGLGAGARAFFDDGIHQATFSDLGTGFFGSGAQCGI